MKQNGLGKWESVNKPIRCHLISWRARSFLKEKWSHFDKGKPPYNPLVFEGGFSHIYWDDSNWYYAQKCFITTATTNKLLNHISTQSMNTYLFLYIQEESTINIFDETFCTEGHGILIAMCWEYPTLVLFFLPINNDEVLL